MFELDFKLLSIFYYIYKFKSVSATADYLALSQKGRSGAGMYIATLKTKQLFGIANDK
jgi:hypothetical protein